MTKYFAYYLNLYSFNHFMNHLNKIETLNPKSGPFINLLKINFQLMDLKESKKKYPTQIIYF